MAKKYMAISNWDAFPHLKGLYADKGNLHRTFCRCGYVHTEHVNECLNCGNTDFVQYYYDRTYEYTILDKSSGSFRRREINYSIAYNNQESTEIVAHQRDETCYLSNLKFDVDDVEKALPELFLEPKYALAKQFFEYMYAELGCTRTHNYDYYYNVNWRTVVQLCEKYAKETNHIDIDTIFHLLDLIGTTNFLSKMDYINRSARGFFEIIAQFERRSQLILTLADNLQVCYAIIDQPNKYDNIDEELGNLIAAYYKEGYISDVKNLLDIIANTNMSHTKRFMFEKLFKEKYADLGYAGSELSDMLSWAARGHAFENAKDYYMQRNKERFCKGFESAQYDKALSDVYNHPADAIINLAKLK